MQLYNTEIDMLCVFQDSCEPVGVQEVADEFGQLTKSRNGVQAVEVEHTVVVCDDGDHPELPTEAGCFGGPENSCHLPFVWVIC